jgi:23S rRNA G2445 N2-methylase RlmL
VSNPPYGLRIGESASLRNLYATLGKILRTKARGYLVALLSADKKLERQLGIELDEKFRTTNGGIPVRLVTGRYE